MKTGPLVNSLVGAEEGKRGSRPQAELRLGMVCVRGGGEKPQAELWLEVVCGRVEGERPQAELWLEVICGQCGEERSQAEPGRSTRVVIKMLCFYLLIIK